MEKKMDFRLIRDTWAEINLDHIAYNIKQIKTYVGQDTNVAAVVKADGYGHGAVGIAPVLMEHGASLLAVATLSEALEIKAAYPQYPVLVMGLTPAYAVDLAADYDIIQTVDRFEDAAVLDKAAGKRKKKLKIHIKLDTGFHRIGIPCTAEGYEEIRMICGLPNLDSEGLYSHLALTSDASNEAQNTLLQEMVQKLEAKGCRFRYLHMADSISAVDYPAYHWNMVRIGAVLYGLKGFHKGTLDLKPALSWKARISHITPVKQGEGVSYDYLWRASCDTRVGTLPFGYADGYPRNMRGRGSVSICGKRVPIVGVICMDQCLVDLTEVPEAEIGTEAIIYGDGQSGSMTVEEASQLADTNKNEIVARISRRVPRIYIGRS